MSAFSTIGIRLRQQWPHALRLMPIVALPFLVLWQASLYFDAVLSHGRRITATREATRRAGDLFNEALADYAADLKIISEGDNLQHLAAGDLTVRDAVARDFSVFASARNEIARVRFIDKSGQEIVRVDRDNDKVVVMARENLQNKADRYFFKAAVNLPHGALYVSPIDLNVEWGKIVVPWQPTLRLATAMTASSGGNSGIIIVNLNVESLMSSIEAERPVNSFPVQLLNSEGYWLAGAPHDQLWGFMFRREITMAKSEPAAWKRIKSGHIGNFDTGRVHYAFQSSGPDLSSFTEVNPTGTTSNVPAWKLVGLVPAISWTDIRQRENWFPACIGLLFVVLITFGWSNEISHRSRAEEMRHRTELELIQKERLAGLGSLVAGVAHELGTPIGNSVTIASSLSQKAAVFSEQVASGQLKRSVLTAFIDDLTEGTEIMARSLMRASTLIRHFKQVAVDQTSERRRIFKLSDLVHDIAATVQTDFKRGVSLQTDIVSVADLDTYAGLLEQVLINLIINARIHGFDEGQQGEVIVSARDLPNRQIEITVRDNGKGIPPEILKRIFEPFFTTRLGLGGSGLGLSITFNIVTSALGGSIQAESKVGKGTSIVLTIPFSAPVSSGADVERTYHAEQSI